MSNVEIDIFIYIYFVCYNFVGIDLLYLCFYSDVKLVPHRSLIVRLRATPRAKQAYRVHLSGHGQSLNTEARVLGSLVA